MTRRTRAPREPPRGASLAGASPYLYKSRCPWPGLFGTYLPPHLLFSSAIDVYACDQSRACPADRCDTAHLNHNQKLPRNRNNSTWIDWQSRHDATELLSRSSSYAPLSPTGFLAAIPRTSSNHIPKALTRPLHRRPRAALPDGSTSNCLRPDHHCQNQPVLWYCSRLVQLPISLKLS